jgi:hypothetical protein
MFIDGAFCPKKALSKRNLRPLSGPSLLSKKKKDSMIGFQGKTDDKAFQSHKKLKRFHTFDLIF